MALVTGRLHPEWGQNRHVTFRCSFRSRPRESQPLVEPQRASLFRADSVSSELIPIAVECGILILCIARAVLALLVGSLTAAGAHFGIRGAIFAVRGVHGRTVVLIEGHSIPPLFFAESLFGMVIM